MKLGHSIVLLVAAACVVGTPLDAQRPAQIMGAPYHDASRAFIDLMIPHHETAIMMAEHHLTAGKRADVKALARRMIADQRQEIAELKATRRALFGSDSSRPPMMRAMTRMMGMDRMRDSSASRATMDSMRMRQQPMAGMQHDDTQHEDTQRGGMQHDGMMGMMSGDMDRMFLAHMILHHQDGIDLCILAEDSQAAARVKQLARKIREGQKRDIADMRRVLAALGAAPASGHER